MFNLISDLCGDSIRGWSGATWKNGDLHPKPAPAEIPVIKETVAKPLPPKR